MLMCREVFFLPFNINKSRKQRTFTDRHIDYCQTRRRRTVDACRNSLPNEESVKYCAQYRGTKEAIVTTRKRAY